MARFDFFRLNFKEVRKRVVFKEKLEIKLSPSNPNSWCFFCSVSQSSVTMSQGVFSFANDNGGLFNVGGMEFDNSH